MSCAEVQHSRKNELCTDALFLCIWMWVWVNKKKKKKREERRRGVGVVLARKEQSHEWRRHEELQSRGEEGSGGQLGRERKRVIV